MPEAQIPISEQNTLLCILANSHEIYKPAPYGLNKPRVKKIGRLSRPSPNQIHR